MLITPICPNVNVRPSAISNRTEAWLSPMNNWLRMVSIGRSLLETLETLRWRAHPANRVGRPSLWVLPRGGQLPFLAASHSNRASPSARPLAHGASSRQGSGAMGAPEFHTSLMSPSDVTSPMRAVLYTWWFQSETVSGPSGVSSLRPLAASITFGTSKLPAFSTAAFQMYTEL